MNIARKSGFMAAFAGMSILSACAVTEDCPTEPQPEEAAVSASAETVVAAKADEVDFSKLAVHPRLFISKADEEFIKSKLSSNKTLAAAHAEIIRQADKLLAAPKQERTLMASGKILPVSREYVRRICALSYAARMTGDDKYARAAEKNMLAAADFTDWNPKHFLDVAEMSAALAVGYDWLYDKLPEASRKKISEAIITKGLTPSFASGGKNGWWLKTTNNWNQVCNGSLVMAALSVYEDAPELARETILRSVAANGASFKSYEPDGVYPEGVGYWSYGTGYETMLIDALESALGSSFGLREHKAFFKSARFVQFAVGSSGKAFNFSDGGEKISLPEPLIWFAAQGAGKASVLYPYKRFFAKSSDEAAENSEDVSEFPPAKSRAFPLYMKHLARIDFDNIPEPKKNLWSGAGACSVAMARTNWNYGDGLYLGLKGGRASYNHGHADGGSFVYDVGPTRWVRDVPILGYVKYESQGIRLFNTRQNSERWTLLRWNNELHNTISIVGETHAVDGYVNITETFDDSRKLGAKLDLTPVFGGKLKRAEREAVIIDGQYLKITDTLEGGSAPQKMRWNICTEAAPEVVDAKTLRLKLGGKTMLVSLEADITAQARIFKPALKNKKDFPVDGGNFAVFDFELPAGTKAVLVVRFRMERP